MNNLPYLEDVHNLHAKHLLDSLFPNLEKNKFIVYVISVMHIIGTTMIQWGIFLKPNYLKLYILYLALILLSYYLFNNYCFMTLLSSEYTNTYRPALYIKKKTARKILIINLTIAFFGIIFPKYSLHNIIKTIFNY